MSDKSLLLGQLIYTSFPRVGFKAIASAMVPEAVQQAFMQKVVYQHWNTYNPPQPGYQIAYVHQLTSDCSLFGWLYNDDGLDDLGRRHIPYFVCYYLATRLHALQLDSIFTVLSRGPASLIDRQHLPPSLDSIAITDLWNYQPARQGVAVPLDIRERSHRALEQGQLLNQGHLLNLFIPSAKGEIVSDATGEALEHPQQVLQPSTSREVPSMIQPSDQPSSSQSHQTLRGTTHDGTIDSAPLPLPELISTQPRTETRSTQVSHQSFSSLAFQSGGRWSLKAKTTVWALAISALPVLVVGTISAFNSQSLSKQLNQSQSDVLVADTKLALQRQLPTLLLGTAVTGLLAGAIAALLANRAIRPVLNAAAVSTRMVNVLRREDVGTRDRVGGKDELVALETNIGLIAEQLPDLLWKQEVEAERSQVLMNITRRIQESLSQEDVLKTTVEEVRSALRADRVVIFRFDAKGEGTFVEESVAPNLPRMLWATIHDSAFEPKEIEQYQQGQVQAIHDIDQASLTDFHIGFLQRFAVKAYLVAPIFDGNELFGLLIAHHCARVHFWQQPEINLFAQLATQVGFALDHAKVLEQIDIKANQAQLCIDITRRIRASLLEEDILKTTVEEVRRALRADRVIVYGFDANWYGTVVAESVLPGWPRALSARIKDPCFEEGYVDKYQAGRVHAINNIDQAGLSDCYRGQLDPFEVKANLVAPILKDDKLFGLLIAHQCSGPRDWQQPEISLFAQLAMQVGFALDHARLLIRVDAESMQTQLLSSVTRRIRASLSEEDILKTTVEEVRRALRADRVIVYGFDANWYGTVVAESVLPGWSKALWANIKDPCFEEGYVDKYQAGRVHAINNIDQAGLSDCYRGQLDPFEVKANLVAPILKDDKLFGLLIAHQCSGPRDWQQPEISLFAQLAMQVGFALDHARLLNQVEQAYQAAEAVSREQRQQKEALQRQVSALLRDSKTVIDSLSTEALDQMKLITATYNQVQAIADSTQRLTTTTQRAEFQAQQVTQAAHSGHEAMERTVEGISTIQKSFVEATRKVKELHQFAQKLSEGVGLISSIVSQIKLQAMNAELEAARAGEAGQTFAAIADKVQSLARKLDADTVNIKPLIAEIQMGTYEVADAVGTGSGQAMTEIQLVGETQHKLNQLAAVSVQVNRLVQELNQTVAGQTEAATAASQSILEAASLTSRTSEQSLSVAESFSQLAATAQELSQLNSEQNSDKKQLSHN